MREPDCGIVGIDESARRIFTARDADDHLVADHERRQRGGVADLVVGEHGVPENRAAPAIEREQVRVERDHEQPVAKDGEATIHWRRRAVGEIGGQLAPVLPERPARAGVDRPREVVGAGHVQHAVEGERRRLEPAAARGRARLEGPLCGETMHVGRRNLRQRTVAPAGVVARERQPSRGVGEARGDIRETSPADALRGPRDGSGFQHDLLQAVFEESLQPPLRVFDLDGEGVFAAADAAHPPAVAHDERHRLRRREPRRGRQPPARRRPEARGISGTRRLPSARRRERSTAASRCRARLDESSGGPVHRWRPTPTARRAPDRCRRAHRRRGRPHTARRRASHRCGHPGRAAGAAR